MERLPEGNRPAEGVSVSQQLQSVDGHTSLDGQEGL